MVIVRDGETDSGMTIVSTLSKTRNEQKDPMDEDDGYSKDNDEDRDAYFLQDSFLDTKD